MSVRKRTWTVRSTGEQKTAWQVVYKDRATGKRTTETFDRKKDADDRAAEVAVDVKAGVHVPRHASITVAEAGENWIARAEADKLERSTVAQYRGHLKHHISPGIGSIKLADLSAPHVASFERELYKKGVEESMRRKVLVSLRSLLRLAMLEGYVNKNAAEGVRLKVSKRSKRKLEAGVDFPTVAEVQAFLHALNGSCWRPLFVTAVFTGMRASELRGLRWKNIDLKKGEIYVRERADNFHAMGRPKSAAGERTVTIDPTGIVSNALKEWSLACPKGELGLVFPTRQSPSNICRRGLGPLMLKAGIVDEDGEVKYSGMHALRHFNASWLINPKDLGGRGRPPKVVQEHLGHSTLAMTMDTYGHLFPRGDDAEELREAELALIGRK